MNTTLQRGGRSIEEFLGQSQTGDFNGALGEAIREAKLTLGSDTIRWQLLYLSGVTTPSGPGALAVTIKAKVCNGS